MSDNIWLDICDDKRLLARQVREMRESGRAWAKADAEYRAVKAKAILEARDSGVSWSAAADIVYAREDVARALMQRDVAEVLYENDKEAINATKLQIRVNEAQLEREWGQARRS